MGIKKYSVQGVGGAAVGGGYRRGAQYNKNGGPNLFYFFSSFSFSFTFTPPTFGFKYDLSMCTGVGGGYGTVDHGSYAEYALLFYVDFKHKLLSNL